MRMKVWRNVIFRMENLCTSASPDTRKLFVGLAMK
jgi:hypothetical protein